MRKIDFNLYYAQSCQNAQQTNFSSCVSITSIEDLRRYSKLDHTTISFENSYRNKDNVKDCDCLIFDLDNDHSDNPDDWRNINDIKFTFPEVVFYWATSRHHGIEKNGKAARPKYHLYFPIHSASQTVNHHNNVMTVLRYIDEMKLTTGCLFPYFDPGAIDAARFLFGNPKTKCGFVDGSTTLDDFIASQQGTIRQSCKDSIALYNTHAKNYQWEPRKKYNDYLNPPTASVSPARPEYSADPGAQQEKIEWFLNWAREHPSVHFTGNSRTRTESNGKVVLFPVECPNKSSHSENTGIKESEVGIYPNGHIFYKCRHSHCNGIEWQDFRMVYDEDYRAMKLAAKKFDESSQSRITSYIDRWSPKNPAPVAPVPSDRDDNDPKKGDAGISEEQEQTRTDRSKLSFLDRVQTDEYKPNETGLDWFDMLVGGGVMKATLTVLLAAPSTGKTALYVQLAEAMARHGEKVTYINLEMSEDQMLSRAISHNLARKKKYYTGRQILQGYAWTDSQRKELVSGITEYQETQGKNIQYIHETTIKTVDGKEEVVNLSDLDRLQGYLTFIGDRARAEGRSGDVVFIDYLHCITSKGLEGAELIKKCVIALKNYAIEYNTYVFTIAAVNRQSMGKGQLTMNSCRDSSAIEYQGDYLVSLNYAEFDDSSADPGKAEDWNKLSAMEPRNLILRPLKTRDGAMSRSIKIYFSGACNYFGLRGDDVLRNLPTIHNSEFSPVHNDMTSFFGTDETPKRAKF